MCACLRAVQGERCAPCASIKKKRTARERPSERRARAEDGAHICLTMGPFRYVISMIVHILGTCFHNNHGTSLD